MHLLPRIAATLLTVLSMAAPARAVTLLRDADIENALGQLARPILAAAGLPGTIQVLLVDDSGYNAFVVDSRHIFVTSGLMMKLDSAAQLQSVLAHEAAHIANGHLSRRMANARAANTIAGLGMALAAAAAVSGNSAAARGLGLGVAGSAQRVFFAHTRAEESAADASGLRYLTGAGADPQAFLQVLDIFRGQELVSELRQDPYARTHPLSRDRLRAIQAQVTGARAGKPDPKADYWFERAQGKLTAWERPPKWTLRRAPSSLTEDIRLMREAVAYHRNSDTTRALARIDALVAQRPKDAYVHDLRCQILLESLKAQASVAACKTASQLAPDNALILGQLGRALLVAKQPKSAIPVLEKAQRLDDTNAALLRDLAQAYAQTKQTGMASVVTAERYALIGRPRDALIHAKRAEGLLPRGSAPWLRAQDVISASEAAETQRN